MTVASSVSMRIELVSRGDSALVVTEATAPPANAMTAVETSSIWVSRSRRQSWPCTLAQSPRSQASRSIWWMPRPSVGPPPSVAHLPRHGTAK